MLNSEWYCLKYIVIYLRNIYCTSLLQHTTATQHCDTLLQLTTTTHRVVLPEIYYGNGALFGLITHCLPVYGVAMTSRLLEIIGPFCKRALQKRMYSAKETYNFEEPTNRSHPVVVTRSSVLQWSFEDVCCSIALQ